MSDIYTEIILDHYKNPQNRGRLLKPSVSASEYNPICGDKIEIYFIFDKNGKVKQVGFTGEGCAISQAATSMLTEKLLNKSAQEIIDMQTSEITEMLNIPISPARTKCAILGLITAKKAATMYKHKL